MKAALLFGLLVSLAFASSSWSWSSSSSSVEECALNPQAGDMWYTTGADLTWVSASTFVLQSNDGSDNAVIVSVTDNGDGTFTFEQVANTDSTSTCVNGDQAVVNAVFNQDCSSFTLSFVSDTCAERQAAWDGLEFTQLADGESATRCQLPENAAYTFEETGGTVQNVVFFEDGYAGLEYVVSAGTNGYYYFRITQDNDEGVSIVDLANNEAVFCGDTGSYSIEFDRTCSKFILTLVDDNCAARGTSFDGALFEPIESADMESDSSSNSRGSRGKAKGKGKSNDSSDSDSDDSDDFESDSDWSTLLSKWDSEDAGAGFDDSDWSSSNDSDSSVMAKQNSKQSSKSASWDWDWSSNSSSWDSDSSDRIAVIANKMNVAKESSSSSYKNTILFGIAGMVAGAAFAGVVYIRARRNNYVAL